MNLSTKELVGRLIELLRTAQQAYIDAAGKSSDTRIARQAYRMADERGKHARWLTDWALSIKDEEGPAAEANRKHLPPSTSVSLEPRLKHAINGDDQRLMLSEFLRLEDQILERYKHTIHELDDRPVAENLQQQFFELTDSRDTLEHFRDELRSTDQNDSPQFGSSSNYSDA